jgi:simple sugar transport system substrate-binding protein
MPRTSVPALAVTLASALTCTPSPDTSAAASGDAGAAEAPPPRIVVVSHGQSSDPFWSIVANGITDAADELDVRVEYQAPVSFDMVRMNQLIEAAVASQPDALIVSVPDADALRGSIAAALDAGLPVLSINSGAAWQDLGLLAHIGQTEYQSAYTGGERLAAAGASRVLCVNHEVGNVSLDERCRGLEDAIVAAGGTTTVLAVDLADPDDAQQRIANALNSDAAIDGMLTLGPGGAVPALEALKATSRLSDIAFGTFDLEADILAAIRDGEVLFAIDQQPFLQGWLGVALMVEYLETGAMPGGGDIIRTGPVFVTLENAAQVIELARQGIR